MNTRIAALGLAFLFAFSKGWTENNFSNTPQMVVKGEASVFKPADQVEMILGVATIGQTSSEALNENNKLMQQVVINLKQIGLETADYQTGRFRVQPIYRQHSKEEKEANQGKEETRGTISHYEALNTIQIKSSKLDLADKIIEAAVKGGANRVEQVNFNLNNPQAYREEAIQLATKNALVDAHALAAAAGVRFVKILYLSLDHWQNRPLPYMSKMAASAAGIENETPLEAGNVEVQATVSMIYEIAPK